MASVTVFVVSLACGSVRDAETPPTGASPIESLQTSATPPPTPTPIPLSPQQLDCITKFWGGVEEFRRYNPGQQHAILQGLVDCVDKELGVVPPPPTVEISGPNAQALAAPPTPIPTKVAGAGVILAEAANPPAHTFPFEVIRFTNEWHEETPSGGLIVWAGYADVLDQRTDTDDFSQGVVVVRHAVEPAKAFPTPSKNGPIRIVDAVGETLALKADDGTMFYFDVAARTFVSSLPVSAPTPDQGQGNHGGHDAQATGTPEP